MIEARFSYMRQFTAKILAALEFSASVSPSETLDAVQILQHANAANRLRVPFDVPTGFVPTRWLPYLNDTREAGDAVGFKHYWNSASSTPFVPVSGPARSGSKDHDVTPTQQHFCSHLKIGSSHAPRSSLSPANPQPLLNASTRSTPNTASCWTILNHSWLPAMAPFGSGPMANSNSAPSRPRLSRTTSTQNANASATGCR